MYGKIKEHLQQELAEIKAAGLYKSERVITSPQRAEIEVAGRKVLNFCANNYLGLSDNQRLIKAAKEAMDTHGYGMSSVRFICGTQDLHKQLEAAISDYFKNTTQSVTDSHTEPGLQRSEFEFPERRSGFKHNNLFRFLEC